MLPGRSKSDLMCEDNMQQETEIVKPKRIQRKRAKGWKAPDGAQYVGRGSMWGNPFTIENIMGNTKTLTKAEV